MIILTTNERSYLIGIRSDIYGKRADVPDGADLPSRGGPAALAAPTGLSHWSACLINEREYSCGVMDVTLITGLIGDKVTSLSKSIGNY